MSPPITIVEVGPRDGLQNEPGILSPATRIELIERLAECGLPVIEAGSFVSPKWVPQMAATDEVLAGLESKKDVRYPVLVPNQTGYELARQAGASEIAVFTTASERFSQKNTNCSINESIQRLATVVQQAGSDGLRVRAYVSCVLGCPYEGAIESRAVIRICERLLYLGCDEISLGDTIGTGTPASARSLIDEIAGIAPIESLAVHFHDTYGQALANVLTCLEAGITTIDASVAGLGGCPYANGASGNVATEDVVYMLHGMGLETGINLPRLAATGDWICRQLQRPNNSKAGVTLLNTDYSEQHD